MSVIEEKKALRTYIRQTERTLDPSYKAESSEAICRCVLALEEYRTAGTVFAFAGTVHEIDTSLLLKETLAAGKTLVLPRCAEGHALDLCVVTSMDELVPGMYGILEPKADCALVTPADIDDDDIVKGIEAIDLCMATVSTTPDLIIAPGWSHTSTVQAVMAAMISFSSRVS